MALLNVENLTMYYRTLRGDVKAVDGVSFSVEKGRSLGLAGESGCGKSSMAITLLRLLPTNGSIVGGEIEFNGRNIIDMSEEEFRKEVRWKGMSMIFQGAMNALNPVHRVGNQIVEAILTHEDIPKADAVRRAKELLDMVGINPSRFDNYPHEFSGGMKQRAVIAMALACHPELIIADEPTTALDVMVQAQVLKAMEDLRRDLGLSMILISHDLAVIAQTCDKVAIMYAGKIVEYGDAVDVYGNAVHPYTRGLLAAFPDISAEKSPVQSVPGFPPNLVDPPSGCRFHPRCALADEECRNVEPVLEHKAGCEHVAACHKIPAAVGVKAQ